MLSTRLEESLALEQLRSRIAALESLQEIARQVTAELDPDLLLRKILEAAMTVSKSKAGSLLLYDPSSNELEFQVVVGGGGDALKASRLGADQGVAGECFTGRKAVLVEDVEHYPRHFRATSQQVGVQVRQLIAVPLMAHGSAIGVLEVLNRTLPGPYSQQDADLLTAFAAQAAVAIENARLYGELVQERDRILAIEANVRRELARDLHDGPAQMLSTLVITTRYLKEVMRREPQRVGKELDELETVALKAMHQVRNILFDLRPVILEEQGLAPTLEQYVAHLRTVEPFAVRLVASSLRSRFPTHVEAAIFSVVQEAVNNAKKHSRPRNVSIGAVEKEDTLVISVRDDGLGFDVAQTLANYAERGSFGLLNMRERAELAQGRLQIKSKPGKGTTVMLSVPLSTRIRDTLPLPLQPRHPQTPDS